MGDNNCCFPSFADVAWKNDYWYVLIQDSRFGILNLESWILNLESWIHYMYSPELRKKIFFFIGLAGAIVLILLVFPFIEAPMKDIWHRFFGVTDSKIGETATVLFDNFLRIIKVVLWMTLIITSVRFLDFFDFRSCFRNSSQYEISSLLRNVFLDNYLHCRFFRHF